MLASVGVRGLIADRFDKRLMLKITQGWLGALRGGVGAAGDHRCRGDLARLSPGLVVRYRHRLDMPARQTFVSELVGPELLPNAIGLNSATSTRPGGGSRGGRLHDRLVRQGWAILSNAITYLAFIAGLLLLDAHRLRIGPRAAEPPIRSGTP